MNILATIEGLEDLLKETQPTPWASENLGLTAINALPKLLTCLKETLSFVSMAKINGNAPLAHRATLIMNDWCSEEKK